MSVPSAFLSFEKNFNKYSLKFFMIAFSTLLTSVPCMFRLSSVLVGRVLKACCFKIQPRLSKALFNVIEMLV